MGENRLKQTTLLLFTEIFPFGFNSEQAFLSSEINHLTNAFQKVIVFPQITKDEETTFGKFQVDLSLAYFLYKRSKPEMLFIAIKQALLYMEFLGKNLFFWNSYRLRRLVYYTARQALVKKWFISYIAENQITSTRFLVYSYWNNEITTGLLGCKSELHNAYFISRAHGHDLNEDYWGYLPCQEYNLKNLDRLFLVSQQAVTYINVKYPEFREKVFLSYLGVKEAAKLAERSKDGILRVVSCSYIVKLKRVELIVASLAEYAVKCRQKLEWTHFGDGDQMESIRNLAESKTSDWFSFSLEGFVKHQDVLKYYQSNPVDLFLHLSESEGVPVAILEAQAHGIPVVAANVGGVSEIVNCDAGFLLPGNPTIDEITEAIAKVLQDNGQIRQMQENSIKKQKNKFDESVNYKKFLNEIVTMTDKIN